MLFKVTFFYFIIIFISLIRPLMAQNVGFFSFSEKNAYNAYIGKIESASLKKIQQSRLNLTPGSVPHLLLRSVPPHSLLLHQRTQGLSLSSTSPSTSHASSLQIQPIKITTPLTSRDRVSLHGKWYFFLGDDPAIKIPQFDDSRMQFLNVPGRWESQGYASYDGVAWLRIPLIFDLNAIQQNIVVRLGRIGDVDEVFFDGHLIGKTGSFPPRLNINKRKERIYPLPTGLIQPKNIHYLTIRVYNHSGAGGLLDGPVEIGYLRDVSQTFYMAEGAKLLVVAMVITLTMIVIFFYLQQPSSRETLFLILAALLFIASLLLNNSMLDFLSNSQLLRMKISAMALLFFPFAYLGFFLFFFHEKVFNIIWFYATILIGLFLILLISSSYDLIIYIEEAILPFFLLIPAVHIIYLLWRNRNRFRFMVRMFSILVLLNILISVNDALKYRGDWPLPEFLPFSLGLLILFSVVAIAARMTARYRYIDSLNTELENVLTAMNSDFNLRMEQLKLDNRLANVLWQSLLTIPHHSTGKLSYHAFIRPTITIGGDFMDMFAIHNNKKMMMVLDLSTDGVSSPLLASLLKRTYRELPFRRYSLAKSYEEIRKIFHLYMPNHSFLASMVAIDEQDRSIIIQSSFPQPPFYYSAKEDKVFSFKSPEFAEIFLKQTKNPKKNIEKSLTNATSSASQSQETNDEIYYNLELRLEKGDRLMIYTEGLANATSFNIETFGKNRIQEFFYITRKVNTEDLGELLFTELDAFLENRIQQEDWSFLVIEAII